MLPVVIGAVLWAAGFVDMLMYAGFPGPIFGHAFPYAALLLVYATGFAGWGWLLLSTRGLTQVNRALVHAQSRPLLGLGILLALSVLVFLIFEWYPLGTLPLLNLALLGLVTLSAGMLLLVKADAVTRLQFWRKGALALIGLWVALEMTLQLAAAFHLLPASNVSGLYVSYGRVYQTEEGATNALTNRYGWHYPDFRLRPGDRRIVLIGGSFVQAVQVAPNKNMGVALERLIGDANTEVLALGFPDYGPGIFADPILYPYATGPLKPNEVILVVHLANDVQTIAGPTPEGPPYFSLVGEAQLTIDPASTQSRHTLWHATITGYEPLNPVRTLQSNSFTVHWLDAAWRRVRNQPDSVPQYTANTDSATPAQPFGASTFVFERAGSPQAETALTILLEQIKLYHLAMAQQGLNVRLVTIPYFPAGFYEQNRGQNWSEVWGAYDLFLPERRLTALARSAGIPILPMGAYMQASGLSVEEIQGLYFKAGTGHLTSSGHQFFAHALRACFYGGECPLK